MKRIILSAYRCDPYGVSEGYLGFMSAVMLAARHEVLLCTPSFNLSSIRHWLSENGDSTLSRNLRVMPVPVARVDGRPDGFLWAVKPGYFLYDLSLVRKLRRWPYLRECDLVWHRTPMSFRYRTSLHRLDLPLVIGPIGGGLKPPSALRDFFRDEGLLYRLRALDQTLLGSSWWTKPLDSASSILVTCDYVRDILPSRLGEKLVTLPDTGIDPPDGAVRKRASGTFTALFVGRLVRYKAPTMAIDAFARMLSSSEVDRDRMRLVVVGDGPERNACNRCIERLGIADNVTMTGRIPKGEVTAWYEAADVFLFPSITEASGNVYLEAMRAALPLVVCGNGGGADIPPDEAAIKVPIAHYDQMVDDFSAALLELASDPERRARMGAAGQRAIEEQYSWAALDKMLGRVLDRATRQGQRS